MAGHQYYIKVVFCTLTMVEFQFLFLVAVYYEVVFIVAAQGSTNQTRLSKQQQRMDTLFDTLKCASNTQTIEQTLMKNQT